MIVAMKPVTSSRIAKIGYDGASRTLAVQFNKSAFVYHYQDVPPETWQKFSEAPSIGVAFSQMILNKFTTEKLAVDAEEDEPPTRA